MPVRMASKGDRRGNHSRSTRYSDDESYSDSFYSDEEYIDRRSDDKHSSNPYKKPDPAKKTGAKPAVKRSKNAGRNSKAPQSPRNSMDYVAKRMLSARRIKINELKNELEGTRVQLSELQQESKILRRQNHRAEKALDKYEYQENEMPTVIQRHAEEVRALNEQLRRQREKNQRADKKLKNLQEELERTKRLLGKMKGLVDDKDLKQRDELSRKLTRMEAEVEDKDKRVTDLEKHIENLNKNHKHELGIERARCRESNRKVDELQALLQESQNQLKEKEKELEVRNIYTLRVMRPPHRLNSSVSSSPIPELARPPRSRRRKNSTSGMTPRERARVMEEKRRDDMRKQRETKSNKEQLPRRENKSNFKDRYNPDTIPKRTQSPEPEPEIPEQDHTAKRQQHSFKFPSYKKVKPIERQREETYSLHTHHDPASRESASKFFLTEDEDTANLAMPGIREEEAHERDHQLRQEDYQRRQEEDQEQLKWQQDESRKKADKDSVVNKQHEQEQEASSRDAEKDTKPTWLSDDDSARNSIREKEDLDRRNREEQERHSREEVDRKQRDVEAKKEERKEKERKEEEDHRKQQERARKDREERERREREEREREEQEKQARDIAERLANDTAEQERIRLKELLLAKMNAIDENQEPSSPSSQKKDYSFKPSIENMHQGKPAYDNITVPVLEKTKKRNALLDDDDDSIGYQPSFGPTRGAGSGKSKARVKNTLFDDDNDSDSDIPNFGKQKPSAANKTHLMDSLFGGNSGGKGSGGKGSGGKSRKNSNPKEADLFIQSKPSKKGSGNSRSQQRENSSTALFGGGNAILDDEETPPSSNNHLLPRRQRQPISTISSRPAINAIDDIDDDIEEVIL